MPEVTLDLSNLGLEFDVIAHSLQSGGLPENIRSEHFAGQKSKWIAEKLQKLGTTCSLSLLISELNREGREHEIEDFVALVKRLYEQPVNIATIGDSVERILELSSGRQLANTLTRPGGVAEKLKRQKVNEAIQELEGFIYAQHGVSGIVSEGSLIADGDEVLAEIERVRAEGFQGIPTHISSIDSVIHGLLPGEYGLFVGGTGEGKSIALVDVGMRNWDWHDRDVIGFTIEMGKAQQERRQVAWACGIDIEKLKIGDLSNDEMSQIKNFFKARKDRENIFYWVDIPENINVAQIERQLLKAEKKTKREFEIILIDYIGLMSPIGAFSSRLNWDAQGEISWNVHNLARRTGKVLWAAAQKKENISDKERRKGSLKAVGLSYMIAQPTDVTCVFTEKTLEGYMEINIAKNRDGPSGRAKLKPDLRCARLDRFEESNV